ncbi:MAG: hypothetical protein NVS4B2_35500 [Chloroflexota bacterium]
MPLKTVSTFRADFGYQGRVADLETLLEGLLPVLQERWMKTVHGPETRLTFHIGDEHAGLILGGDVTLGTGETGIDVCLDPGSFAQLVLGFRPAWWLEGV